MKLTIENGFAIIETCGMTIKFPADDMDGSDDRVEIRCGQGRVFVEKYHDGPLVSALEKYSGE